MSRLRVFTRRGLPCFQVHLQPRASKDEIAGVYGDALKIRLTSPPLENRANRHLIEFLAEILGVPNAHIEIVSGQRSRAKTVAVTGISPAALRSLLGQYLV